MSDNGQAMNSSPPLSDRDAELLSAYIDDMLAPDERTALESRLQREPLLRSELLAMRRTVEWINALPVLKAPRDFTLQRQSVQVLKPAPPTARRSFWLWAASAAAAMIVLAIGFMTLLPALNAPTGDVQEAAGVALQSTMPAPPTATLLDVAPVMEESAADDAVVGGGAAAQSAELDTAPAAAEGEMPPANQNSPAARALSPPPEPMAADAELEAPAAESAGMALSDTAETAFTTAEALPDTAFFVERLRPVWEILLRIWQALITAVNA